LEGGGYKIGNLKKKCKKIRGGTSTRFRGWFEFRICFVLMDFKNLPHRGKTPQQQRERGRKTIL
jgi:hypothetical protein